MREKRTKKNSSAKFRVSFLSRRLFPARVFFFRYACPPAHAFKPPCRTPRAPSPPRAARRKKRTAFARRHFLVHSANAGGAVGCRFLPRPAYGLLLFGVDTLNHTKNTEADAVRATNRPPIEPRCQHSSFATPKHTGFRPLKPQRTPMARSQRESVCACGKRKHKAPPPCKSIIHPPNTHLQPPRPTPPPPGSWPTTRPPPRRAWGWTGPSW